MRTQREPMGEKETVLQLGPENGHLQPNAVGRVWARIKGAGGS
jgi:hypothetical protein